MNDTLTLPTRKDEDWRYSDTEALAGLWPVAEEAIRVPAGKAEHLTVVLDAAKPVARHLALVLEDQAEFDLALLNLGGAWSRIGVEARLGEGARLTIGGVQIAGGEARLEIVTTLVHAGPDAFSRQTIRSVAGGRSAVTYLGKVRVERGADGTDGAQSVRAMLLDRTAEANARPELEIYADDVKCAHGCAVGELDQQGLFYLASRGLPPPSAKALMLQAFLAEAFAGLPDEDNLRALAQARLESLLAEGVAPGEEAA